MPPTRWYSSTSPWPCRAAAMAGAVAAEPGLDRTDPDQRRVVDVGDRQVAFVQFRRAETVEKRRTRQHVAEHGDRDPFAEHRLEELSRPGRGDAPEVSVSPVLETHAAHARQRHQQDPARLQDAVTLRDGLVHRGDDVKRLGQDHAIVRGVRNVGCGAQVGDHGGAGVGLGEVDDVAALDGGSSKATRVVGLLYLEHHPADIGRVLSNELLDVDAVQRAAALVAPVARQRRGRVREARRRAGAAPSRDSSARSRWRSRFRSNVRRFRDATVVTRLARASNTSPTRRASSPACLRRTTLTASGYAAAASSEGIGSSSATDRRTSVSGTARARPPFAISRSHKSYRTAPANSESKPPAASTALRLQTMLRSAGWAGSNAARSSGVSTDAVSSMPSATRRAAPTNEVARRRSAADGRVNRGRGRRRQHVTGLDDDEPLRVQWRRARRSPLRPV